MKYFLLALILVTLSISCTTANQNGSVIPEGKTSAAPLEVVAENSRSVIDVEPKPTETPNEVAKYPGISIDQEFPMIENHDFREEGVKEKEYSVNAAGFEVTINKLAPRSINGGGKSIFEFKTLHPNDYWASLVGVSNLLGKNSKEIYVVASGPGAVCCSNYWITDISSGTPRNIFRSEDFGRFRGAIEVFDAEGDGIYEIVQFDSAFRYFLDDCGSCSPEPRAVFKYDERKRQFLPAKGIQQDFVKENNERTEKWIAERHEKMKNEGKLGIATNLQRTVRAHTVDLIYTGEEKRAWQVFETYFPENFGKEETRAEIKKILQESKFYQALRKQN